MKTGLSILFILGCVFIAFGFTPKTENMPPQKKLALVFHNHIGSKELVLGEPVKNILGETIAVQKFRYYVSNFSVTDKNGKIIPLPVQYFLVDEADALSKTITLTIPDVTVTGIRFLLGVDSIRNVSGVQTGALDPLHGMFWTWNSGYIMAKLEGVSELANTAGHSFTFHVGGFRTGMNTTRMIDLNLSPASENLREIHINADINQWFKSRTELKIAENPVCHSPGALAMRIADNFSSMFSINSVR